MNVLKVDVESPSWPRIVPNQSETSGNPLLRRVLIPVGPPLSPVNVNLLVLLWLQQHYVEVPFPWLAHLN